MKTPIIFAILFLPGILLGQDWIERGAFSVMSAESDLIVVGIIKEIEVVEKHKKIGMDMPLKKAFLHIENIKKGDHIETELLFYYKDTFTGCGSWPVMVKHKVGDSVLLFARVRNDSIFHNYAFDQSTSSQGNLVFAKRLDELIEIKKSSTPAKISLLEKWIIKGIEDIQTIEDVSSLLEYKATRLLTYLGLEKEKFNFSYEQRLRIYTVLERYDKIGFENEGLLKIMRGTRDQRYLSILRKHLLSMSKTRYCCGSNGEYLMESILEYYPLDKELKKIYKKYRKDARIEKELANAFIAKLETN